MEYVRKLQKKLLYIGKGSAPLVKNLFKFDKEACQIEKQLISFYYKYLRFYD
jgi:hypothetical protein